MAEQVRPSDSLCAVGTRSSSDVKQLVEDPDTGAQSFKYVRTGADHYSLAFTYDCVAWSMDHWGPVYCGWIGPDSDDLADDNFLIMKF